MKKILILIIVIIAISQGCKTVVEINIPNEPPKLVINSTLEPDEYIKIHLSQSQHILDEKDFEPISGAAVDIYEDEAFITTLPDSTNGNYISANYKPKKGKTYKITVSKEGFEDVSAQVIIPPSAATVNGVELDTVEISEADYIATYLRFNIQLEDDIDVENFYDISIVKKNWLYEYDNSISPPVVIDSVLRTSQLLLETKDLGLEEFQSYGEHIVFNDNFFNGKTYSVKILSELNSDVADMPEDEGNTTFYLKVANTSKSYYLYEVSFMLQKWTAYDPLAEPVQVFNNITNGYGVLGACNVRTIILEE
jgi:hypothetical protein